MRRAAAVDANQPSVVDTLRRAGCVVECLHSVGGGVPDLLVGRRGVVYLLEVKDGSKPPSKQALTDDQKAWHAMWAAFGVRVQVVRSDVEALRAVGLAV